MRNAKNVMLKKNLDIRLSTVNFMFGSIFHFGSAYSHFGCLISYITCQPSYPHRMYVIGSMVESEVLRNEFRKSWEIHTHLGHYVSFYFQYKINRHKIHTVLNSDKYRCKMQTLKGLDLGGMF